MTEINERAAAIRWIQAEMADYGLTMEELAAAGCFDPPPPPPPPAPPPVACYRNAAGQSWDGTGDMPDWLRRAVNAGQLVDFYRVGCERPQVKSGYRSRLRFEKNQRLAKNAHTDRLD